MASRILAWKTGSDVERQAENALMYTYSDEERGEVVIQQDREFISMVKGIRNGVVTGILLYGAIVLAIMYL